MPETVSTIFASVVQCRFDLTLLPAIFNTNTKWRNSTTRFLISKTAFFGLSLL